MRIPGGNYHLPLFHLPLYLESCENNKRVNLHLITHSLELQMRRIYCAISVHVIIQLTLEQEGFELHGSTYTWTFFRNSVLKSYTVQG